MSDLSVTRLTSICSNLATRAFTGAMEMDNYLLHQDNRVEGEKLQKLLVVSIKLQQVGKHVDRVQERLRTAPAISSQLKATVSARLPECDAAAAVLIKQITRLDISTTEDQIDLQVIIQYGSFLNSTIIYLVFLSQVLMKESVEDQEIKLGLTYAKVLMGTVESVCSEVMSSGSILLSTPDNRNLASSPKTPPPASEDASAYSLRRFGLIRGMSYSGFNSGSSISSRRSSTNNSIGSSRRSSTNLSIDSRRSSSSSNSSIYSTSSKAASGIYNKLNGAIKAASTAIRMKPEPLVVELCQSATDGSLPRMKDLLLQGAKINGRDENGDTALICAVLAHQLDAVQLLLEAGADCTIRSAGSKGKSPLFHSVDAGFKPVIDLLLSHGAPVNQRNGLDQSFFVDLIAEGAAPQWIELLLSHGADACAEDVVRQPLPIVALQNRQVPEDREEVVALLLRHGAKPNSCDINGTPLISLCFQQECDGLIHLLLGLGADPNSRDFSGTPLLVTAVSRNDRILAKALLERGADPNATDNHGRHLILIVLRDKSLSVTDREGLIEMLLQHGARGATKDASGVTALEYALLGPRALVARNAEEGPSQRTPNSTETASLDAGISVKISQLLLKHGADPNQRLSLQPGMPTILTYALEHASWDLAGMALSHGANPNMVGDKGQTPLCIAIRSCKEDIITLLIQFRADVNQAGPIMPFDMAKATKNIDIIDLLQFYGAKSA
ncbi:ankyrin repeat-containing domain protein [Xylariales sp. PMI_506]|nr:ankyrin repeat-containing domain protein [Xylariales sp. PMI_506]